IHSISYDLIEWIAGQPWCDGNAGMVGISAINCSAPKPEMPTMPALPSHQGCPAIHSIKSEAGGSRAFDSYDLIEWIAGQPWCDGNAGMVGISGFGAEQLMAAKLNPSHLKAIFPFD